ncbi:MAG: hypothetical protein KDD69_20355 [Bdellovibrionales bacterium]|nr:hypothetical protein [Bdellovibrionales bacterium]
MSNKTLFLTIFSLTIILCGCLFRVANIENEWRGFWVSTAHVLLTAVASYLLLRDGNEAKCSRQKNET